MQLFDKFGLKMMPLLLAVLLFAASLTPSLIPRGWLVQGALGGLVMALGYMIGRFVGSVWKLMELPELTGKKATIFHAIVGLPVFIILLICLANAHTWQNGIRERMNMDLLDSSNTLQMIFVTVIVFVILMLIGFVVRITFDRMRHWLYRYIPKRPANVAGFILTVFIVFIVTRDGILDYVIASLDKSYTVGQALFDTAPPVPADARITGSSASLIDWGAMGQPGRDYITSGPDADMITNFTGRDARRPIRVYVGLAQSDTAEERAEIALEELKRQGGFERKILIVAMPTGTGWLDPGAVDTVEYMHGGDTATVAVQYSYLQSPLALILETSSGLDQARALIAQIHDYWKSLPAKSRPRLYVHGLSLGAWSSMYGTNLFTLLDDPIDGALWAGPPFPSSRWNSITAERDNDSPYVLPSLGDGRLVRFANHQQGPGGPDGWGSMRIVYLQYSSDPIVFYEPASLFRAPRWMKEMPSDDVSPDMRFIPIVTQFQLAVDMALATSAPPGHGHAYYGPDYIKPWVAVTAPENWNEDDTKRLIAHCNQGFKKGCRRE